MLDKIKLTEIRKTNRGKIIGFVASAFDLMHPGYVLMLKEAKEHCDYLIAAVHVDPSIERPEKNKPIMTLEERIILIEGNKYIDDFIVYKTEKDLFNILIELYPDIRFLGEDWKNKDYTGKTLNIPIHWINRDHGYSATKFRQRIYEVEKKTIITEKI